MKCFIRSQLVSLLFPTFSTHHVHTAGQIESCLAYVLPAYMYTFFILETEQSQEAHEKLRQVPENPCKMNFQKIQNLTDSNKTDLCLSNPTDQIPPRKLLIVYPVKCSSEQIFNS